MADYVTLSCPSCGAKLQITSDVERFACGYCGTEQLIRRSGGIVTIAPIVEGIKLVQAGVDKTASELAIQRLEKEIDDLGAELSAIDLLREKVLNDLDAAYYDSVMITALNQMMKAEKLRAIPLFGYTSGQRRERFSRLSKMDLDFLIQEIEPQIRPQGASDNVDEEQQAWLTKLRRLRGRDDVLLAMTDKQRQLEKHRQIVSQ